MQNPNSPPPTLGLRTSPAVPSLQQTTLWSPCPWRAPGHDDATSDQYADPQYVAFLNWLWPQTGAGGAIGAVAQHAHVWLLTLESLAWRAEIQAEINAGMYSGDILTSFQSMINSVGGSHLDGLRLLSYDALLVSINNFGPNANASQLAAAWAAFLAS